jgi:hypothetical protein
MTEQEQIDAIIKAIPQNTEQRTRAASDHAQAWRDTTPVLCSQKPAHCHDNGACKRAGKASQIGL